MKISIVGLGSGDISAITYGAYLSIKNAEKLFLRTEKHPIVQNLKDEGISFVAFDDLYESQNSFSDVYRQIVDSLYRSLQEFGEIVYAVPGHPYVAEKSVEQLLKDPRFEKEGVEIGIISSTSFLDDMFVFLEVDPTQNGLTLLDALDFETDHIARGTDIIFTQVYSRHIASELKLKLLEYFDAESQVIIFKGAGIIGTQQKMTVPLYQIDQVGFEFDHLSSVCILQKGMIVKHKSLSDLVEIMQKLRSPEGCPWDRMQTAESLLPHLKEELNELENAVLKENIDNIVEELGDILMLLVLETQIASEDELFDIRDVMDGIVKKMIFRHPHVFSNEPVNGIEQANLIWERKKIEEKLR